MATFHGTGINDTQTIGFDYLYGGDGNDVLGADQFGYDVVEGGRGDDYIFISIDTGFGSLYGGDGNDLAFGDPGDGLPLWRRGQ